MYWKIAYAALAVTVLLVSVTMAAVADGDDDGGDHRSCTIVCERSARDMVKA